MNPVKSGGYNVSYSQEITEKIRSEFRATQQKGAAETQTSSVISTSGSGHG